MHPRTRLQQAQFTEFVLVLIPGFHWIDTENFHHLHIPYLEKKRKKERKEEKDEKKQMSP